MEFRKVSWLELKSEVFADIAKNVRVIMAPEEGARLLRAFIRITDPRLRRAVIHLVEEMGPNLQNRSS